MVAPTSKKTVNLTGQKFGNLTVLSFAGVRVRPSGQRHTQWECACVCGKRYTVLSSSLLHAKIKSCGCVDRNRLGDASVTHGARKKGANPIKKRVWRIWAGMRERCTNPNNKSWPNYGGRGIFTCESWKQFANFWSDMGDSYKPGLTIERRNNDGPYCKENCCWDTRLAQAKNKRKRKDSINREYT